MFVTSKLWNTFHATEHVVPACKKQLADWGLEYFDLYLIQYVPSSPGGLPFLTSDTLQFPRFARVRRPQC